MSERRVLLVDDEPSLLLSYSRILERSGYEVVTAASVEEAEKNLREQRFGLLICDLTLGGRRSGFQVIGIAGTIDPSLPAILLTGDSSPEVIRQAESSGARLVLKPVEVDKLLGIIASSFNSGN